MNELLSNPVFGLLLTLAAGWLGVKIRNISGKLWLNPMLLSVVMIIVFLKVTGIDYQTYKIGGDIIHMFLGPVTVLLAVPLYQNRSFLRKYFKAIMIGVIAGSFSALLTVILFSRIFGIDIYISNSIMGRSVTTPIGIAISEMLEANQSIVILAITVTGIFSIISVEYIYKLIGITHPVAKGVGLGTAAHAIGTAKAMEIGEVEGAMSALSIGLAGITTVIWVLLFIIFGWL